ncbi:LuxR C-terminal-related transcriptional regulator (plasmid) [Rhodococcus opacus]|uniref:response regulator transcription factor n=1 Tax=Rhodococcus opacus TaxID=37919 RepID=UPI0034D3600D
MSSAPSSRDTQSRSRIEHELSQTIVRLLTELRDHHGLGPTPGDARAVSAGVQLALLDDATESALRGLRDCPAGQRIALGRLVGELRNVRQHVRAVAPQPGTALSPADVACAIRRLRGAESVAGLRKRVCAEAARTTGLGCVLLSEVHDNMWTAIDMYVEHGEQPDLSSVTEIPLGTQSVEGQAAIRRTAVIADLGGIPPTPEIAAALNATSYVVAPIVVSTGVIGMLHAKTIADDQAMGNVARDLLGAFASGFGTLFERAMLSERLDEQKRIIVQRLQQETREAEQLTNAELSFDDANPDNLPIALSRNLANIPDASALPDLTAREREVFHLLAAGKSNAAIADDLVISVFTVKTHVKKILRKLGAMNRSEAIYLYLKMTGTR